MRHETFYALLDRVEQGDRVAKLKLRAEFRRLRKFIEVNLEAEDKAQREEEEQGCRMVEVFGSDGR
jgi:hypothetical protein